MFSLVEWVQACHAGTQISKDEILEIPCDVLVPAAIGGVITGERATNGSSLQPLHADRTLSHSAGTLSHSRTPADAR